ncbi:MAG: gamma-glutamyltransferase [Candidatus Neomarinimicrobiota bacterium]
MKNVIAAGDKTTVEAAQEILWIGGNAYDAAVAAMFVAMVSEPTLTSAGGGGHLMALPESGSPVLFDFFAEMPSGEVIDSELDFVSIYVNFGTADQEFHIGKGAVAVPGAVAGLLHVQEVLGSISRMDVLAPAIRAAKEGVILSHIQGYLATLLEPILTHDERGRQLFAPQGTLLGGGDRLVMSDFADFLEVLAHEGSDLVYKGEVAKIIVDWAGDGGLLKAEDLENYRVKERTPLRTAFRGHTVLLNPPPAQSGLLIDVSLSLLENTGCARKSPMPLKDLVTAFDVTNQVRRDYLAHGMEGEIHESLTGRDDFPSYVESFHRLHSSDGATSRSFSRGETTHISILDKKGNAASLTVTNGEGCGYVLPEAGFMLNNMLGEEDLNPGGFHRHQPGERLPSMVAPTIVVSDGRPILLTGTAGSNRIRSVIVQIIAHVLCDGLEIQEATDAPRAHLEGTVLHVEPGMSEEDLMELENRYTVERWESRNVFFGGANSVMAEEGAGDPRRGGFSLTF